MDACHREVILPVFMAVLVWTAAIDVWHRTLPGRPAGGLVGPAHPAGSAPTPIRAPLTTLFRLQTLLDDGVAIHVQPLDLVELAFDTQQKLKRALVGRAPRPAARPQSSPHRFFAARAGSPLQVLPVKRQCARGHSRVVALDQGMHDVTRQPQKFGLFHMFHVFSSSAVVGTAGRMSRPHGAYDKLCETLTGKPRIGRARPGSIPPTAYHNA